MFMQQRRLDATDPALVDAARVARWVPWLLWLYGLALAFMACPYEDTVRDIAAALSIADGTHWPSTGPGLAFSAHLGPAWFYLLAPIAASSSSWLGVALFVAALAGLKYPLAWRLGSSVADWRYGLLFAFALSMPGWQHLQAIFVTHTSLVETATLAYLLLLRGYVVQPGVARALALGLGFGLALHAHPTTIALLPLSLIGAWRFGTRAAWRPRNIAVAAAGALLPFASYLLAQANAGWPDAQSTASYVGQSVGLGQLEATPALASAVFWSGPRTLFDALLPGGARAFAFGAWALLLGASVIAGAIGWRRSGRAGRALLGYAAAACIVTLCTLCILRERVPWYMAYLPTLAGAALLAAVWRSLLFAWPRAAPIAALAMALCVVLGVALDVGLWRQSGRGEFRLPGGAMHDTLQGYVAAPAPAVIDGTSLPARFAAASGRFLCAHGNAVLHASYASYVDSTAALDRRMRCGSRGGLQVGGGADIALGRHWLGMPQRIWRALALEPETWIGPFGLSHVVAIGANAATLPVAAAGRYPLRDLLLPGDTTFEAELDAPAGSALVVSAVLGFFAPVVVEDVRVNDAIQPVLATTAFVSAYRCAACAPDQPLHWRIRFRAARADLLDAVALAPGR
ncbi:MAG TPA: hypothetical protein VLB69_10255 [Rudaea sp.]|nr:hypothetical protein [Rudaea sp.]